MLRKLIAVLFFVRVSLSRSLIRLASQILFLVTGLLISSAVMAFSVSGNVEIADVVVTVGGVSANSDASGNYVVNNVPAGNYTIIPSKAGYIFNPDKIIVDITGDITNQNFKAVNIATIVQIITSTLLLDNSYTISGNVGIPDVTVTVGEEVVVSDASGNYKVTGLSSGTYTITPEKYAYDFSPATKTVTVGPDSTNNNFTPTALPTFSISGDVGIVGANVSAAGITVTSDASGNYTIPGRIAGTYTITVTKPEYTFISLKPCSNNWT